MKILFTLATLILVFFSSYSQNFEWAITMGGTNTGGSMNSIVTNSSGEVYVTGMFIGTVDFDPGPVVFNLTSVGTMDIFITKLSSTGNFIWAKSFGGSGYEEVLSIATNNSGDVFTTGVFSGTIDFDPGVNVYNLISAGGNDLFVLKLDAAGNFDWAKSIGGTGSETGWSIALDNSGNVFLTGSFGNTVDFDPDPAVYNLTSAGSQDIFILKLNNTGNFIWAKSFGSPDYDYGRSLSIDIGGDVYFTGAFSGTIDFDPGPGIFNLISAGARDIFIAKFNSAGNFIWAGSIGGNFDEHNSSITVDVFNFIYVTGSFLGTAYFDPGIGTYNLTSNGSSDIFLLKLDSGGNFLWSQAIGDIGGDGANAIASDNSGNIYITSNYEGTVDFDPSAGVHNLVSVGNHDISIAKFNSLGSLLWAHSFGSSGSESAKNINLDISGNIFSSGLFENTVDFDPGSSIFNLTSNTSFGWSNYFLKWSQCTPPSLTTSIIDPLCHGGTGSATVTPTGNAPFTYLWSNNQTTQTATGLPAGTHTVTVTDDSSCAAIATVTITEPAQIVSNISSTPSNFNSPNCNGSVAINPTGGTPPYNISWSSGTTSNLCQGWYTATIADANNCVVSDSVYVNFVVGIDELNAAGISVYPNPVGDLLFIKSEKEIGELKIFDVVGKLYYSGIIKNNNEEIDVHYLDAGVYFIETKLYRLKFLKE